MLELQKQPIVEGGQALTNADICVRVLGSRSGYIKGLGHGPRPPPSSSRSGHAKSQREIELENEIKATRELIQSQETRCENPGKFEIFFFGNIVNYRYSTGCKPKNSLDLK